jgi:hypothetical protein
MDVHDNVFHSNDIEDFWTNGPTASFSCIGAGTTSGTGNITSDPLFVTPGTDFHLSQIPSGQASDSPCVDAGSDLASNLGLDTWTTRTDNAGDAGIVDMGYHYPKPPPGTPTIYVQINDDVTYTPEPATSYDLIRGDLDDLADVGGNIDLGPITCIGDDDTTGAVNDPTPPTPGQTFFYLLRIDAASHYGLSSDGKERLPGSGSSDCP